MLDLSFAQDVETRLRLIKKIQADIQERILVSHRELLLKLEKAALTAPGQKRISAANCLLALASCLPWREERQVLARLATSKNASVRGQVYRRVKELRGRPLPGLVEQSFQKTGDWEALRLLIDRGSPLIIRRHFSSLEAGVQHEGWLLARLYLRLGCRAPATLARVRKIDPLTYCYLCAKQGKRAPKQLLLQLLKDLAGWRKFGLAVWCCGQMGYADLVSASEAFVDRVEQRYNRQIAELRATFDEHDFRITG